MRFLSLLSEFEENARALLGWPPRNPASEQLAYGRWLADYYQPQFDRQITKLSRSIDRFSNFYGVFADEEATYQRKLGETHAAHSAYTATTHALHEAVTTVEETVPAFRQHPTEILTVKIGDFVGAIHALQSRGTQQLHDLVYVHSSLRETVKPESVISETDSRNLQMAYLSIEEAKKRPGSWSFNRHERRLSSSLKALDLSAGP